MHDTLVDTTVAAGQIGLIAQSFDEPGIIDSGTPDDGRGQRYDEKRHSRRDRRHARSKQKIEFSQSKQPYDQHRSRQVIDAC